MFHPLDIVNYKGNICIVARIEYGAKAQDQDNVWVIDLGPDCEHWQGKERDDIQFGRLVSPDKCVLLARPLLFQYDSGITGHDLSGLSHSAIGQVLSNCIFEYETDRMDLRPTQTQFK